MWLLWQFTDITFEDKRNGYEIIGEILWKTKDIGKVCEVKSLKDVVKQVFGVEFMLLVKKPSKEQMFVLQRDTPPCCSQTAIYSGESVLHVLAL